MDDFAGTFTDRMTTSLVNPPGAFSYPIAAYSYLIVRKTTMTDCVVARELVSLLHFVPFFLSIYICSLDT